MILMLRCRDLETAGEENGSPSVYAAEMNGKPASLEQGQAIGSCNKITPWSSRSECLKSRF